MISGREAGDVFFADLASARQNVADRGPENSRRPSRFRAGDFFGFEQVLPGFGWCYFSPAVPG